MIDTVKYDLTKLAKRWNFLQRISILSMLFAFHAIAATLVDAGNFVLFPASRSAIEYTSMATNSVLFIVALYVARETWVNTTAITRRHLKRLRSVYRLLMVAYVMLFLGSLFALGYTLSSTADAATEQEVVTFALLIFATLITILLCFFCLRQTKYLLRGDGKNLGFSLEKLHDFVERNETAAPTEARWMVRLDQPTGLFWLLLGGLLFLLGAGLYDFVISYTLEHISDKAAARIPSGLSRIGTAIEILGAFLILKGRSYFLPTAEAILALDKRAPVLYLRSFMDEKPNYNAMSGGVRFIDRSLEMKLSKYFNLYGPFVAIGSKQDKMPKLGAIRLMRSDEEWQREVASLMVSARAIVAAIGVTAWIKWELSEIIDRNHASKTLFVFPVTKQSGFRVLRKQLEQQAQRLQVMADLMPTDFQPLQAQLEKKEFLLAYVARQDRSAIVTCMSPTSDTQFLAVVVAHYLLMGSD